MKPLIGITCSLSFHVKDATINNPPLLQHCLGDAYQMAVENAGGIPVLIPSTEDPELCCELACVLDAVLFTGGPDVDPRHYGERAIAGVTPVQPRRDLSELALARHVLANTSLPVLGICRGMQVLNTALGGTLTQDLAAAGKCEHRMSMYPRKFPSHEVRFTRPCRLRDIFGSDVVSVNSFHHQAVREVAPPMQAVALSEPDGVIEAMEMPGERFVAAVQWHPEGMSSTPEQQALFRAFVAEAARQRS